MKITRIFFRGRSTAEIMRDAEECLGPADCTIIVARTGDALMQDGDVEGVDAFWKSLPDISGEWQLICNGGATDQLVPLFASVLGVYYVGFDPTDYWKWTAYEIQPDTCTLLAGGA